MPRFFRSIFGPPAVGLSMLAMAAWAGPDARQALDAAPAAAEAVAAEAGSTPRRAAIRAVSPHVGEMMVEMEMPREVARGMPASASGHTGSDTGTERLRFEPWELLEEIFGRDDVVYVMRHGPTDWSGRDAKDVAPTDCGNQRVMGPDGLRRMREMGALLAANDVLPARIVVSEWCRNQQTLDALLAGFDAVDPALRDAIPVETAPDLDLLLALRGAPDVKGLRGRVAAWKGSPDREGPLLLITHFTNIEELTTFTVYEGEILVLDPRRGGRVLGYLRLASSGPDIGHFLVEARPGQPD